MALEQARDIDQWKRGENLELSPHFYRQVVLDKGTVHKHQRKGKNARNWISACRIETARLYPMTYKWQLKMQQQRECKTPNTKNTQIGRGRLQDTIWRQWFPT